MLALSPGCALFRAGSTDAEKAAEVQSIAYAAASFGTAATLEYKPEYRPAFALALQSLEVAIADNQITGQDLRNILAGLPVPVLRGHTASIGINSATILFDTLTGKPINLEDAPLVLAAATGIRDGLKVGLGK